MRLIEFQSMLLPLQFGYLLKIVVADIVAPFGECEEFIDFHIV